MYVGGQFATASSSSQLNLSAKYIAVWNVTSQTWSSFGSSSQNGVNTSINALAYNSSSNLLYVGGVFTTVSSTSQNAISANRIAVWNVSSQTWSLFGSTTQNGTNNNVNALTYDSSNNLLYVGGIFKSAYDTNNMYYTLNNIISFNTIQNIWYPLDYNYTNMISNGTNSGSLRSCAYDNIRNIYYVGGSFSNVYSYRTTVAANNIAAWNVSTQTWSILGTNNLSSQVYSMVYDSSNNLLYIGGGFSTPTKYVSVYNISSQIFSAFGSSSQNGVNGIVYSIVFDSSNNLLYVGGNFTTASSSSQLNISAKYIAVWNISTQTWSPLGSSSQNGVGGASPTINSLIYDSSNNLLYVGGIFTTASSSSQNAISANNIAVWNITTQTWSPLGSTTQNGTNNTVNALTYDSSNNLLYVGGAITTASSTSQNAISTKYIAVWNITSQTWSSFGSSSQNGANTIVNSLAYDSSNKLLYVGGNFSLVSSSTQLNISANSIAAWNISNQNWIPINSTNNPALSNGLTTIATVYTLSYNNNKLFVGGTFSIASTSKSYAVNNAVIYSYSNTSAIFVQPSPMWVSVGSGTANTLAYSTNGTTWTGLGKTIFTDYGMGVAYGNNMWIAVGSGTNTIAYSTNGTTWTGLGLSIFGSGGYAWSIAWNGSMWVVGGSGSYSFGYSTNGTTWTGSINYSSIGMTVAYGNNMWVGGMNNGTNTLVYSTNGITWTGLGKSAFSSSCSGICYNNSMWTAIGMGTNTLAYSTDGTTWTGLGSSIFANGNWKASIASNGQMFIATGQSSLYAIAYSTNGTTWTGISGSASKFNTGSAGNGQSAAWDGTKWVAVGGQVNAFAYSTDGTTWIGSGGLSIFSSYGFGVASNQTF